MDNKILDLCYKDGVLFQIYLPIGIDWIHKYCDKEGYLLITQEELESIVWGELDKYTEGNYLEPIERIKHL
jgi:hypothetical protein